MSQMEREQLEKRLRYYEDILLLVESALDGVRLASSDQNPLGWRDMLGCAVGKIRQSRK